jgi:hypothetical protein
MVLASSILSLTSLVSISKTRFLVFMIHIFFSNSPSQDTDSGKVAVCRPEVALGDLTGRYGAPYGTMCFSS